jgi:uncharacterized membrane protein YoaK (UPF0700 family)
MVVVVAMGFQNTFGKLFGKATYGMTTVMTGNVTQAALDLMKVIKGNAGDAEAIISLKKQLILILGFLVGCLGGALLAKVLGLVAIILPGLMLASWLMVNKLMSGKGEDISK